MTTKKEPAEKPAKAKSADDRFDALEKETAALRELMRRNGWTC